MLNILISLVFVSSLASSAGLKANGCDLSQVGDVSLTVNAKHYKKANYKAITPSGKNFKTIFVGSTINVENTIIKITDIHADKRVKDKPRTGTITVDVNSESVLLNYTYDKGHFNAKGVQKNSKEISFALEIKALLCHSN